MKEWLINSCFVDVSQELQSLSDIVQPISTGSAEINMTVRMLL